MSAQEHRDPSLIGTSAYHDRITNAVLVINPERIK